MPGGREQIRWIDGYPFVVGVNAPVITEETPVPVEVPQTPEPPKYIPPETHTGVDGDL